MKFSHIQCSFVTTCRIKFTKWIKHTITFFQNNYISRLVKEQSDSLLKINNEWLCKKVLKLLTVIVSTFCISLFGSKRTINKTQELTTNFSMCLHHDVSEKWNIKYHCKKKKEKNPLKYYNMNHRSFISFLNQLRQTRMWSMVPRHNRIWWRRPLVFPLQVFIQWHHTHHHKEQHIHRQLITICHIRLPAMTLWWHRQPHTFMTQPKTRPKKSN